MSSSAELIEIAEPGISRAVVAPSLGGWLIQYEREMPDGSWAPGIFFDQAVVDRYPERMYTGNPLLFPFVSYCVAGGKEHHYEWGGQIRPMPQHGFARRSPWRVVARSRDSVAMELADTDATRAAYPFQFSHRVTYALRQGRLHFTQEIENRSPDPMPFGVGIHPYLPVPITPKGARSRCFLKMPECVTYTPVGKMESFVASPRPAEELSINEDFSGTLFLGEFKQKEITLVDPESGVEIAVNWEDAPEYRHCALWSSSTEAPFFCVEPWTSLPNAFGRRDGELTLLQPGQVLKSQLYLEVRPLA